MVRAVVPIAVIVAIQMGCSLTPETIPAGVDCGPEPSQVQIEAAVQTWVQSAGLKDPGSAQTRNAWTIGRRGMYNGLINGGGYSYGWMVEFQVNGKNSFGGYVGFRTRHVLLTPDGRTHWQMEMD